MPDPRLLRYFVAVAETGSVSAAAREVRVAQPSLSRQLRTLEAVVGVALFDRAGGRLRLTAGGRRFLVIARDLLHRHNSAVSATRFFEGVGELTLVVAATMTTIVDVIAPFIAEADLGGITLDARDERPEVAYEAVTRGEADVAMTNEPPPARLASFLVGSYPVLAYVADSHRWAGRRSVALDELASEPLISSPASGTRRVLESLHARGLSYGLAHETSVPQVAQALAAAGKGVAILSDDPRFGLRPLTIEVLGELVTVPMYASWDASHYAAGAIEQCAKRLQNYCVAQWPPLKPAPDAERAPLLGLRREPRFR
jgi:DNA-binding transcriptional LysR family regulator